MKRNSWSWIFAFLMGVVLFWSFGKDWLNLESASVFLAGLFGVALVVIVFGIWSLRKDSHHEEN